MSKSIIKIENVSKCYLINRNYKSTLRGTISQLFQNRNSKGQEYWSLKNINLNIKKGEILGIIGKNGAGKSTLLKLLSRVTYPTVGKIRIFGKISSLLEIGAGFHPELTGGENIFLLGSLLGMTRKEINDKYLSIVEFSGIKSFIDTPVKRYSSGMFVRLAFSVAVNLESNILLLDEILAVGDMYFKEKCLEKINESISNGTTVLFVSHDLNVINNICTKCILLEDGVLKEEGPTKDVIYKYEQSLEKPQKTRIEKVNTFNLIMSDISFKRRQKEGKLCLEFEFIVRNNSNRKLEYIEIDIGFNSKEGKRVGWASTKAFNFSPFNLRENEFKNFLLVVENWPFITGYFSLTFFITSKYGVELWTENIFSFFVNEIQTPNSIIQPSNQGDILLDYKFYDRY